MFFVDSHCHFDFSVFDADRSKIWASCHQLGVKQTIIPGVSPDCWPKAREISENFGGVYYSAGLHPWWIKEFNNSKQNQNEMQAALFKQIITEVQSPRCIAIGECGLDKMIDTPRDEQVFFFEQQLKIAKDLDLPLIVHCRKMHNDTIGMIKRFGPLRGVVHGFSGSWELAMEYWTLGFYLGIGGTMTYVRAKKTRHAVKRLPLESLLLETDAPDMPLNGQQGRRNSPENILEIARALADIRGESIDSVARQTSANVHQLFRISSP